MKRPDEAIERLERYISNRWDDSHGTGLTQGDSDVEAILAHIKELEARDRIDNGRPANREEAEAVIHDLLE